MPAWHRSARLPTSPPRPGSRGRAQRPSFPHQPRDHLMDLKLKGLSVLVTGGTAGIGEAIVKAMAQEGCDVAFCSRSPEKVAATLQSMQGSLGRVRGRAIDVTHGDDFSAWLRTLERVD